MSEFVKHPLCKEGVCLEVEYWQGKRCEGGFCICGDFDYSNDSLQDNSPIFEERETDDQARADRRARARECK